MPWTLQLNLIFINLSPFNLKLSKYSFCEIRSSENLCRNQIFLWLLSRCLQKRTCFERLIKQQNLLFTLNAIHWPKRRQIRIASDNKMDGAVCKIGLINSDTGFSFWFFVLAFNVFSWLWQLMNYALFPYVSLLCDRTVAALSTYQCFFFIIVFVVPTKFQLI